MCIGSWNLQPATGIGPENMGIKKEGMGAGLVCSKEVIEIDAEEESSDELPEEKGTYTDVMNCPYLVSESSPPSYPAPLPGDQQAYNIMCDKLRRTQCPELSFPEYMQGIVIERMTVVTKNNKQMGKQKSKKKTRKVSCMADKEAMRNGRKRSERNTSSKERGR